MIRGAFLVAPKKIEIREFEKPELPRQALLTRTGMCGVCGTDVHMYKGTVPIIQPIGLGHEWVGIVEEIGEEAPDTSVWGEKVELGDKITTIFSPQGCGECIYCKFYRKPWLCVSWRHDPFEEPKMRKPKELNAFSVGGYSNCRYIFPRGWIYKIPEGLPLEIAVLIEPFSTGLHVGNFVKKEGLVVVIQGSGPIGLLSLMAAKLSGVWKTIVVGGPKSRLKLCEEFGADYVIDIEEVVNSADRIRFVKSLTPGSEGADVVVEAAGVPSAFVEGIRMTRRDGTFLEVGHWTDRGPIDINPYEICWRNVHIYGLYGYNADRFEYSIRVLQRYRDQFPLHKVVTHKFPLNKTVEALETAQRWECMKAVIIP